MVYTKVTPAVFMGRLRSGLYPTETGAKRAVGKMKDWTREQREKAHQDLKSYFLAKSKKKIVPSRRTAHELRQARNRLKVSEIIVLKSELEVGVEAFRLATKCSNALHWAALLEGAEASGVAVGEIVKIIRSTGAEASRGNP